LEFERKEKERKHAKKYPDEIKRIKLPRSFKEVDIGSDDESKRKVISEYDQRLVLLKDAHLSGESIYSKETLYFSGRIFYDEEDKECYQFQVVGEEEKRQMHFHDLEMLLVSLIR